jgi:uncharacterized protein (DUF1501 family)
MSVNPDLCRLSRRQLLFASGVLFTWAHMPKLAQAEGRDPRLLVIVLRGALDGLSAVAPAGDPNWIKLRDQAASTLGVSVPGLKLDDFFVLNPAMTNFHRLYGAGQAAVVHAVATPYRERSHFDGQDVLESGSAGAGAVHTGWLNRALGVLEPGAAVNTRRPSAFAAGPVAPLIVRGPAPVLSWTPPDVPSIGDDTEGRILELYRHTDPILAKAMEEHVQLMATKGAMEPGAMPDYLGRLRGPAQLRDYFERSARTAATFMSAPDGPRVGALMFDGWDTHAGQGSLSGRLANLLGALDGAIAAAESGMQAAWNDSVVVVVTEFGRTARINGTEGTDHGTATVALLAGGAVKGGRVIADWPGLRDADLYENRDLKPTIDLRGILKGVLADHLRVDRAALDNTVFPESRSAKPWEGLVRS